MWKIWDFIKERRRLFGGIVLLAWAFSLFTAGETPRLSPGPLAKVLLALVSYPGRTITYTLEGLAGIGRDYFLLVGVKAENHRQTVRAGLAIRRWIVKEALTAFTINFLADLFRRSAGRTAGLKAGRLAGLSAKKVADGTRRCCLCLARCAPRPHRHGGRQSL